MSEDPPADPARQGQLLLLDGEPVAVLFWAHDYAERDATGWFVQLLDADGEPDGGPPHRLPGPPDVDALVADGTLPRDRWLLQAETAELVSASAAIALAERLVEELRGRS